jgi:hypothetical protein
VAAVAFLGRQARILLAVFLRLAAQLHEAGGDFLDSVAPLRCEHCKKEVGAAHIYGGGLSASAIE